MEQKKNSVVDEPHSRERRVVGAVLLGFGAAATFGSIGFEVYLAMEGCCDALNPTLCVYEKEFDLLKLKITNDSDAIDALWKKCELKFVYIDYTNLNNYALWIEVDRLLEKMGSLIEDFDTDFIADLEEANLAMQSAIEAKNVTILDMNSEQLFTEYNSFLTNEDYITLGRHVAGYLSLTTEALFFVARKRVKLKKFNKIVAKNDAILKKIDLSSSAFRKLGDPQAVIATVKKVQGRQLNFKFKIDWAKKFAHYAVSVGVAAVEIINIIDKAMECSEMETTAKKSLDDMKITEASVLELQENVTAYWNEINEVYDTEVKGVLIDGYLKDLLYDIKNISESGASSSSHLAIAITTIDDFLQRIEDADDSLTDEMVKELKQALGNVTYTVSCYALKAQGMKTIKSDCQAGTDDISNIYDKVVSDQNINDGFCTDQEGLPYTTLVDIEKMIVIYAEKFGFNVDCKLNNEKLINDVCDDKCSGFSKDQMMSLNAVTQEQLDVILLKCENYTCPLTPIQVQEICNLKEGLGLSVEAVLTVKTSFSEEQVREAYESCGQTTTTTTTTVPTTAAVVKTTTTPKSATTTASTTRRRSIWSTTRRRSTSRRRSSIFG